ncbi:MAG: DoxX family protein [Solirubrobacteraceae bacterium]
MRRRVELATGVVFVIASLPKFFAFGWELDAFRRFGLPAPEAWVIAAGVIELAGGVLLITGRHVRAAALVLGATMAVAVWSSGILEGDVIPSLTLAPVLLVACVYLLRRERAMSPTSGRTAC